MAKPIWASLAIRVGFVHTPSLLLPSFRGDSWGGARTFGERSGPTSTCQFGHVGERFGVLSVTDDTHFITSPEVRARIPVDQDAGAAFGERAFRWRGWIEETA